MREKRGTSEGRGEERGRGVTEGVSLAAVMILHPALWPASISLTMLKCLYRSRLLYFQ